MYLPVIWDMQNKQGLSIVFHCIIFTINLQEVRDDEVKGRRKIGNSEAGE